MQIDKSKKILIIVESPKKIPTFQAIFKKAGYNNIKVMASVGHIMELADDKNSWKNSGIYPEQDFALNLRIATDKTKVVSDMMIATKAADLIYIMSDGDREGEVIAWSIIKFLNLPIEKCLRAVTQAITQKAVINALENPIQFDNNMVEAGLARLTVDKDWGYTLSSWLRAAAGGKSSGRCQSAALLLLVLLELSIRDFIPETYYDLYLHFDKNGAEFRAKYIGTADKTVKHLETPEQVKDIVAACSSDFKIIDVTKKIKKENPKPPFDTIAFQKEASSKLGLDVKAAQDLAQMLFQGVDVNGQHIGLVTYIRTDSTDMSPEFIPDLKAYIDATYGTGTFNTPRTGKKQDNAQEGHEALRCADPTITPDDVAKYVSNNLLVKVYKLIWQRTIACAMPPAEFSETTYLIENNGHRFSLVSNELIKQGYKAVYTYKDADDEKDDNIIKETFKKDEILNNCSLEGQKKETTPPSRLTQATAVEAFKKEEIGRPSTTANLIVTLLDQSRNYCVMDGKNIVPTQHGIDVVLKLRDAFPELININYTREQEKLLDQIATGKLTRKEFVSNFHKNMCESIDKNTEPTPKCPKCGADMVLRQNKKNKRYFYGCSTWPNCNGIVNKK